jgi:hypothetical protein
VAFGAFVAMLAVAGGLPGRGWAERAACVSGPTAQGASVCSDPGIVAEDAGVRAGLAEGGSSLIVPGYLYAVAASSETDAWAVGSASPPSAPGSRGAGTLIAHWDATHWSTTPSPSPGKNAVLQSVAAVSPRDAWAVGGTGSSALILHWDGTAWKQTPSPHPGTLSELSGVAAVSPRNVWAVGVLTRRHGSDSTLIVHWNGRAWKQVPSPAGDLSGVAFASPHDGWAVGNIHTPTYRNYHTLILHWNGRAWKRVLSPNPGTRDGLEVGLSGVATISPRGVWAIGDRGCGCGPGDPFIEHRNGGARRLAPPPQLTNSDANLLGVASVSASDAWVVGASGEGDSPTTTAIWRWNGIGWQRTPSPSPGTWAGLNGVALVSPTSAWAVGHTANRNDTTSNTLFLHWDGTAWQ